MENKKISLEDLPNLTMELINKVDILTKMVSELAGLVRPEQNSSEKMSLEEVAKYLNQSKHTIYKKTSKGIIPYHKRGKLYFIKKEIDSYILNGKSHVKKANNNLLGTKF